MVWETTVQSQVELYQRLKKKKRVLDASLLNTKHYKVQIKSKWSNPRKSVAPSPTVKKGAFRLPLTMVGIYVYTHKYK